MIAVDGGSQLKGGSLEEVFSLFFKFIYFFLNGMSCLITEPSEVLVWVAEPVLCATISKEKNRAVCSHLFCGSGYFLSSCVLRCTEGHSCSTIKFPLHTDLYTGGPHWVSRRAELVRVWVYSKRYFLCARPQKLSCVLAAVGLP